MFKTGIYEIDQIKNPVNLKTIFGKDKKISITLYNELAGDIDRNDIAEKILLNFTDERGAFKRTYSNRFEEFDRYALKEIRNRFSPDSELMVHDVAISDGRTACDFFEKICVHFPKLTYYASDYDPHIFVIESGQTKVVLNSDDIPLEIVFPPFVFNFIRESLRYPLNHFIRFILEKTIVKRMILESQKGHLKAQARLLFCPQSIALTHKDARFQLMQHNLLKGSPLSQSVTIFRAMNILNPGYFTLPEFKVVMGHIFNALSDKGLFITGSNQDSNSILHGGIFQKTKKGFEKIGHSGDGSPVEGIIINYIPPADDLERLRNT